MDKTKPRTREEISALEDQFLNGRGIKTTEGERLMMIDEVLKRRGHHVTDVQIVRRWLSERGLT